METTSQYDESARDSFRERVHGDVLVPGEEGYDEARTVWNAKIDREPALVVRCTGNADVMAAVDFAREQELDLAIKGGGHHIAGHAVCDDGLVIDLTAMNAVSVDPENKTAWIQGGATWGDLNHETRAFGLETVGMPHEDVGVGGFTLGGGMSLLSRMHGLAIDNLRAVDVVTADGELVRASEDEHPELFWALRGGGGNFGVVTGFEFDCHEVHPEAMTGMFLHPIEDAGDVIRCYREFTADAPDEVVAGTGVLQVPADPEFPDELHGETVALLMGYYMGDIEAGEQALQPLSEFGDPLLGVKGPKPYSELGEDVAAEQRNHWKNHCFAELPDAAIDTFVEQAVPLPTPLTKVIFFSLGGAVNRVDENATAYPHRDTRHLFEMATQWGDPEADEACIAWARQFHEAMAPYATGGEYVNNQTDDDSDRVRAAYGDNYERLVTVKREWDPENLFHLNQNIDPAG